MNWIRQTVTGEVLKALLNSGRLPVAVPTSMSAMPTLQFVASLPIVTTRRGATTASVLYLVMS